MRRSGRLLALLAPDRALVELDPESACARCARGQGCGARLFAPSGESLRLECRFAVSSSPTTSTTRAAGDERPRPGDRVELEIIDTGSAWLGPVLLAYGLPTLGLLGGVFAPEPWTPFAALAGLGGGLLAWRLSPMRTAAGPCQTIARIV